MIAKRPKRNTKAPSKEPAPPRSLSKPQTTSSLPENMSTAPATVAHRKTHPIRPSNAPSLPMNLSTQSGAGETENAQDMTAIYLQRIADLERALAASAQTAFTSGTSNTGYSPPQPLQNERPEYLDPRMFASQSPSPPRPPLTPIQLDRSIFNVEDSDDIIVESIDESTPNSNDEDAENSPPRTVTNGLQSLFGFEDRREYLDFRDVVKGIMGYKGPVDFTKSYEQHPKAMIANITREIQRCYPRFRDLEYIDPIHRLIGDLIRVRRRNDATKEKRENPNSPLFSRKRGRPANPESQRKRLKTNCNTMLDK